MTYEELLGVAPYSLSQEEKEEYLAKVLIRMTAKHQKCCTHYRNMLEMLGFDIGNAHSLEDIPFLPVRLFKDLELLSVPAEEVFKTMTSSGTTGQKVSKIFLDRTTAARQQKVLSHIVSTFTGTSRMPMLIIDCPSVVKNREMFSARGAGILGFSMFGKDRLYVLDDNMHLQLEAIQSFLEKHKNQDVLLFGFTFMIWKYFYHALRKESCHLDLSSGIMIHGGGWKKLTEYAVSPMQFKSALQEICGIRRIHDYYGMVEQTGCIYMECEEGHLHASAYSDIIVRRGLDFSVCDVGERGILQVLSCLPTSYPGHSLLTEDEGVLLGVDDCPCGRKGKYFKVLGRLRDAEIRGCSDTYATNAG